MPIETKLSERLMRLLTKPLPTKAIDRFKSLCWVNRDLILAALRAAEQPSPATGVERELTPDEQSAMHSALRKSATIVHKASHPTGAEQMREMAAKVCDDEDQDLAYAGQHNNWVQRQEALKLAATAIRALPLPTPSPDRTAEALRVATEQLSVIYIVANEESQNGSGYNATMWAGVKATAREALTAIKQAQGG